jgi:hypothetical protein
MSSDRVEGLGGGGKYAKISPSGDYTIKVARPVSGSNIELDETIEFCIRVGEGEIIR